MTIIPLRLLSQPRNGVGAFILQCKRLEFSYCDWSGSSRGMNGFLKHLLPKFAKENPQIELVVSPRPRRHPIVRGVYINGREKVVCVRGLEHTQVLQKVEALRNSDGTVLKKRKKAVESTNAGVRGVWSPFHAGKEGAWRV